MMRIIPAVAYFSLLVLIITGIGSISAEEVYELKDNMYSQRVFGFSLELPSGWEVDDKGEISDLGDYIIDVGPDEPDCSKLHFSFLPLKGLTLLEFTNEAIINLLINENVVLEKTNIGDLDCYVTRHSLSMDPADEFPELTSIISRIGDHFVKICYNSVDKNERDEMMDVLETIRIDSKIRQVSFLAVENHWHYGLPVGSQTKSDLILIEGDPELHIDTINTDGSEQLILDDFAFASRFPAGEMSDDYGYRVQYYQDGRYHVDNRGKIIDVYVPDMNVDIHDFRVGVDIRFEGGHPVKGNGIVFRGSEKGFYLFDLTQNGFYALYKFDGEFQSLQEKKYSRYVKPYEENRIEVYVHGGVIKLYINGESVKRIRVGDELESGFVGLYVCAGSWVSFDNYCVEIKG